MNANSHMHEQPTRIGLFGGTFDPIHRGHEQVAREVRRSFALDCVYFIPCAVPPHKMHGPLTPAANRLEMIRRALSGAPGMAASDVEILRDGPSYTIDTMRHFKKAAAPDHRLFFLLGLDAFLEMHTWKEFQHLLDHCAFIVMSRPSAGQSPRSLAATARAYAQKHLSGQYTMSGANDALRHPDKKPIFLARVTPLEISSSAIRQAIKTGAPSEDWVNPAVARYIEQEGLYQ